MKAVPFRTTACDSPLAASRRFCESNMRVARLAFAAMLALAATACAGEITIYDKNLDPWKVSWTAADVTVQDVTPMQNKDNPKQTIRVSETKKFPSADPIVILFEQQKASADQGGKVTLPDASAGLHFRLDATITNAHATKKMTEFEDRLKDLTPADKERGTLFHTANPHFHPAPLSNAMDPYKSTPLKVTEGANNPTDFFKLGKGVVNPNGGTLTFTARIHEILIKDMNRKFELIETPTLVPEPADWALALVAWASHGILGSRWPRRWRGERRNTAARENSLSACQSAGKWLTFCQVPHS